MLIPSAIATADSAARAAFTEKLSVGLAVLLIVAYAMGMLFSLKTHLELFASAEHGEGGEAPWPTRLALSTLAGVTAFLVTNNGRSIGLVGVLVLMVYLIFAMALYLLPPRPQ
jgi:Ca2+/H+ antiporter